MKRVIVASENPVKINTAREGFSKLFPDDAFEFIGVSVPSGVADQPLSDEETILGARNRIARIREKEPEADYFVGIEGGMEEKEGEFHVFAWIVVENKDQIQGRGRASTFFLPPAITKHIREGKELGEAADIVFNEHNLKQGQGTIGMMTEGYLNRTDYYLQPMLIALVPFKHPHLFREES